MGIPWLLALRAIPWDTILANAPTILRSAETLVSETRARPAASAAAREAVLALADRITALEQRDRDTAALLAQTMYQIAALTTATEVLEARMRWCLVLGGVASILALVAVVLALVR
jgi:hypothetical protein